MSMEFSRQEYWSGLPFPTPVYLPDPGIKHTSPVLKGGSFTTSIHECFLEKFQSFCIFSSSSFLIQSGLWQARSEITMDNDCAVKF